MINQPKRVRKFPAAAALILTLALLLAGAVAAAADPAPAQPDEPAAFSLTWDIVANGGTAMSSAHYTMLSTAGQAVTGQSNSAAYGVHSGFWYGLTDYINRVFMPMLRRE
jgi:ABC-type nitrate/sulfonate/bicarbonate transport system permease component